MIDVKAIKCNSCGGTVIFTSNSRLYGREYGSGKMYYCTQCGAYVGTHKPRPEEALGILGNKEMRDMKMRCHALFDTKWKNEPTSRKRHIAKKNAYRWLADKLEIPVDDCHFGYFNMDTLNKAFKILVQYN